MNIKDQILNTGIKNIFLIPRQEVKTMYYKFWEWQAWETLEEDGLIHNLAVLGSAFRYTNGYKKMEV